MSEALRSSGKHVRLAMAGVAAMLLGGCADSSRMGDPFADPFKSAPHNSTEPPRGRSISRRWPPIRRPGFDPGSFFADAFKPFDAPPAPAAPAAPSARRAALFGPQPIAVQSQPLAAPSPAAAPAAPVFSPARPSSSASVIRSAPSAVGGWTSEGGVPVVVAQGESVEMIAQALWRAHRDLAQRQWLRQSLPGAARRPADDPGLSRQWRARRAPPLPLPPLPRPARAASAGAQGANLAMKPEPRRRAG